MEENYLISTQSSALPPTPSNTSPPIEFSRHLTLFAAAAAILVCILGVTGNLLTVVALSRDTKLKQKATTYFVISLAFSDLLFCAINLPLTASRYIHQEWTLGPALCRIFPFFFYGNVAASLMSMVAITINRYVLISYYNHYTRIYTPINTALMIAAVWIFSFGMIFPPLVDLWGTLGLDEATFSCTIKKLDGSSPKKFLFLVAFLLPSLSILLCYSAIFHKVKTIRNNLEAHCSPGPVSKSSPATKSKSATRTAKFHNAEDLKLTKMMLTIFILFLLCFLPLMLVNVLEDVIRQPYIHIIASVLAWTSAAINPAIYSFLNQQYQQAFRALLCPADSSLPTTPGLSESQSSAMSWSSISTPGSTKSCSLASSSQDIELKYFSQGDDFTIVNEKDIHTQSQLSRMGSGREKYKNIIKYSDEQ